MFRTGGGGGGSGNSTLRTVKGVWRGAEELSVCVCLSVWNMGGNLAMAERTED